MCRGPSRRPPGVYGPGDVDHFTLFQSAMLGWNLFYGNREHYMSCIYVGDCVRGILEAARHEQSAGKGYFLTSDVPLDLGRVPERDRPRGGAAGAGRRSDRAVDVGYGLRR